MSLFGYWYLPDLIAAQQKLCASAASTNTSIQACTSLDATSKTQWNTWYTTMQAFCAEVPVWLLPTGAHETLATGSFIDQLELYQRELLAWQQRLSAKCSLAPVVALEAPNTLTGALAGLAGLAGPLKIVSIAAAVIAAAYVGSQVVALVPSARLRARTARERERTARHALRRS